MKKIYPIFAIFFISAYTFGQATFLAKTGINYWNNAASWTIISGTDPDGIPDADDDVIIQDGTTSASIMLISTPESCNTVYLNANNNDLGQDARLQTATGGSLSVAGNVSLTDGSIGGKARLRLSTGTSITISGNIVYTGVTSAANVIVECLSNTTLTLGGDLGSGGTFVGNNTSATLVLNGTGAQTIQGSSANYTYKNITQSGSGTVTLAGALDATNFTGNLTINAGTFDNGGFAITGASGATLTVAGGAVLKLTGTSGFPTGFGTTDLQYNSTVEYAGSSQTVAGIAYSNLNISNSGTKTLADNNASVNGVLLIGTGAIFDMAGKVFTVKSDASYTGAIGQIDGTLNGATQVLVQRYANQGDGWYQICSPVTGKTFSDWIDDFVISGPTGSDDANPGAFKSLYYYDETQAISSSGEGYVSVTNITDNINSGANRMSGYMVWLQSENPYDPAKRNFPMTIDVQGSINTGDQIIALTHSGNPGSGWHLVNNPYPSSISWDGITRGPSVKNIAYVLSAPGGTSGSWQTLDATDGADNDRIALGEAFWVSVSAADNITIQETDKNPDATDGFHNANKVASGFNINEFSKLQIQLEDNGYYDYAWIKFHPEATENYDPIMDGDKLEDIYGRTNIATLQGTKDLVINYLPLHANLSVDVPIRIWNPNPSNTNKTYKVTLSNVADLLSKNKCITFEDTLNNVSFALTKDTTYTFTMNDAVTDPVLFLHISYPVSVERTNATCSGDNDGQIIVTPNYTGTYNIDWYDENSMLVKQSVGITGADTLSGIGAGTYYVFINGTGMCSSSASTPVVVYDGGEVNITANVQTPLCSNTNDGAITVMPEGNGTSFTYVWNTGNNNAVLSNLSDGVYSVTVTDNNGCAAEKSFTITSPTPVALNINKMDASCEDSNDGIATVIASGDNPPFTYSWNTGDNSSTISGLAPGNYEVTVTDANGCSAVQSIDVNANITVSAMFSVPSTSIDLAAGGIFMPQNQSSGAMSYEWNFGDGGTSIDINPTHVYGDTGVYVVTLNAYNGNCADVYTQTVTVYNGATVTSSKQLGNKSISVLNMPEYILVNFNDVKPERVELFNVIGQKVYEVSNPVYKTLQISKEHDSGIYLLKVISGENTYITKIINN